MLKKQPKKFEELLVQWRSELNLSQVALAEQLGVSAVTVSHWESGKFKARRRKTYEVMVWAYENGLIAESPKADEEDYR